MEHDKKINTCSKYEKFLPGLRHCAENTKSSKNPTPHCAGVVYGGKIFNISCSTFERTTCCGFYTNGCHAEAVALEKFYGNKNTKKFPYYYTKKKMYSNCKKIDIMVIKINKSNNIINSKCCSICAALLKTFNVRNIIYSNEKSYEYPIYSS